MAYCKNCHKVIEDGLKYCDDCAKKINNGEYSENYLDNLLKSITDENSENNSNSNSMDNINDSNEEIMSDNVENSSEFEEQINTVDESKSEDIPQVKEEYDESTIFKNPSKELGSSESKDDMDVLEKIFDNFSSDTEEEEPSENDGSDMNIEELIQEGNRFSEDLENQKKLEENEAVNSDYDENGKYIAENKEDVSSAADVDAFIDNSSEDDLLNLLDSMSNDIPEPDDKIDYGNDDKAVDDIDNQSEETLDSADESMNASDEASEMISESNEQPTDDLDSLLNSIEANENGSEFAENSSSDDETVLGEEVPEDGVVGGDTSSDILSFMSDNESSTSDSSLSSENNDEEFSTEEGTVFMAKPKKSLLQKLFGNVPDKNPAPKEESEEEEILKEARKESLEDEEEEPKPDKKAEKEKKKKEKEEQKKELKARKQREKEEKKRKAAKEEEVDTGHINKVGSLIIFILAAAICGAIIILQSKFSYFNDIRQCKKYYDQEQYAYAYQEINGMELKSDSDKELYQKLRTIMYVQEYVDDSDNFYEVKLYDKSANALLIALNNYTVKLDKAKENGVEDVYEKLHDEILKNLNDEFGISEKNADYLLGIEDNTQYTKELEKYTEKLTEQDEYGKE